MTEGLIGVIVPVYKVEKYIAECIDSILSQTYTKFRLILVDDGSPDNAGKICDEYAKKDSRITVIHQENAGVTRARARGVEGAEDCEWITFVDGDDTIKKTFLYKLKKAANSYTDIVLYTCYYTESIKKKKIATYNFKQELSIHEYRKLMIRLNGSVPWGRLFRKSIITETAFKTPRSIYYGEDAIMNLRISFCTNKNIITIDEPLYFYRQETQGVSKKHQHSGEYCTQLMTYIRSSIPKEHLEKYVKHTIPGCLLGFRELWGYKYRVKEMKTSEFYQELRDDIKKYKYQLPLIDHIIFYNTNIFVRFLAINIKKILNKLHISF